MGLTNETGSGLNQEKLANILMIEPTWEDFKR